MIVFRVVVQRINGIVVEQCFVGKQFLSNVFCVVVVGGLFILFYVGMFIVINENCDKVFWIINEQDVILVFLYGYIFILCFLDDKQVFVYLVMYYVEGEGDVM